MRAKSFFLLAIAALGIVLFYGVFALFGRYRSISSLSETGGYTTEEAYTEEVYEETRDYFLNVLREQNPAVALEELRERITTDKGLARTCHPLVHELGRATYEKYQDFGTAMSYQDDICNSGYLHGVIESRFLGTSDIASAMKTVCDPYPQGSFMGWQCYHGIGHGAMLYTSNDLPEALALCESLEDAFARSTCGNGVFMENFNTDQKLHPSVFLKNDDLFYPCTEQKIAHKADCYLYAPTHYVSLHHNDYAGALMWCGGAEFFYRIICAQGVGSQAMKENILAPSFVEDVCAGAPVGYAGPCIHGMIDIYINHYGVLEPARVLCETMQPWSQSTCVSTLRSREGQFQKGTL